MANGSHIFLVEYICEQAFICIRRLKNFMAVQFCCANDVLNN